MFCGSFFIVVSKLKLSLSEFSLFEFSLSEFDFICEFSLAIFLLESLVKSHVLYSLRQQFSKVRTFQTAT